MALHYHRLYQISSPEARLSLENMKQLLDKRQLHRYTSPQQISLIYSNNDKNN